MNTQENIPLLVERARQGEEDAFEKLLAMHRGLIGHLIRSRLTEVLRQDANVEDLYQETSFRAFKSLGRFEYRGEDSFFRWLAGIALHVVVDFVRRRRPELADDVAQNRPSSQDSPSKGPRREERFSRLQEALDSLSPDHKKVIVLAWLRGMRIDEIAQNMDRSSGAVRKLLLRGLRKLRSSFGDTESLHLPGRSLLGRNGSHAE